MKRALIVGCGYTGMHLAARLLEMDFRVVGTTRSGSRAAELESAGIEPLAGELSDKETLRRIDKLGPEVVAYFVPPQAQDDPLPMVLAATARAPVEAFVYASSTSVYGDRGGDWVDEMTMVRPETPEAEARQAAERQIVEATWSYQTRTRICRISGIYGPGRTLRRPLESGEYVLIEGHDTWVNRIHVDDLVSGLIAAWQRGGDGRVYNLVDAEPHRASEYANLAADLQGLARPQWIELSAAVERIGKEQLRRKLGSKRVRSRRLKDDLRVELQYPTYRDGLPAAVGREGQSRES
ncbi:MAG: NAD-dependent epimerase/dehydratase family protein [Gemmatimonadota bacterium]|nr:MAG: NAD-dependent epimerase/dehydratase family protein [Gemmatimonadota bacterium]